MSLPLPSSLTDRYRIERELGRGGMAVVYLAQDLKHARKVAIKVMLPEMAAAIGQDRFLREIEIAARLTHPHILPLYDSGAVGGQLYYVMPYIDGESLRSRLSRETQLPIEDALRLTREIASALNYAHQHGLVHRDVKPENILLADGIALLADFGVARALSPSVGDATAVLTGGGLIGTPQYMAPEQAGGGTVDGRTDLYALACVLYEMLAGEPPFTGPDPQTLLHQHLNAEPRPVTDRRPVPPGVATVISRGLSKLPVDRFPTAASFAEALSIASGAATPTPSPVREATATPNNLPKLRTHFIGREKELAEYARLLGDTSLLTLTGIGGCGKTRLALELADRLLDGYPEGVWFADLAPVTDPERVPLRVAAAMGIKEVAGVPVTTTLVDVVADRRILLLVDNCEHVLNQVADLVETLLASCGNLRIVATSREGLAVPGERPVSVRSLRVPDPAEVKDLHQVESAEAVRLFLDRAQVVAPGFQLTEASAPAVVEIVRRLDGIPLALELAAARMKILSVEQIREKLDDRFRLLTGTSRALPRHQTLRATIQWSHDHLDEEERRLFRLLSVFSGGWDLDAAPAVAGAGVDEFTVMDLLSQLVDKSLIQTERTARDTARYGMLETVRQFAQEQLEQTGEGDAARTRHLDHYVTLVREAAPHMNGREQGRWMARLNPELENLLLAFAWCARAPEGDRKGLSLAAATGRFWEGTSLVWGLQMVSAALERAGTLLESREGCEASLWAAVLAYRMGRYELSLGHLERTLALARKQGDKATVSHSLHWLATASSAAGREVDVHELYTEAVSLGRESGDPAAMTGALIGMGEYLRAGGDLDGALTNYNEALDLARKMGNDRIISIVLLNRARGLITQGRIEVVPETALESLDLLEQSGVKGLTVSWLDVLAGLAAARSEWTQAARFHGASDALCEEWHYRREPPDVGYLEPLMDRVRDALGDDAQEAARRAGAALTYDAMLAEGRAWLESVTASGPDTDG
jgi:predicted ATPase/tRNA A-37 threonylcarbamoyl transferase component Bud32